MLLAFLPLGCAMVASLVVVGVQVAKVHRYVQQMFEEHREVGLTHSIQEELDGIRQWVDVLPHAAESAHQLILADQRQHLQTATTALARINIDNDPSRPAHQDREAALMRNLQESLGRIGTFIAPVPPPGLLPEIDNAIHHADVLAGIVEDESRTIGEALDRCSERMIQLVVLLSLALLATLVALIWLFVRRVLRPLAELRVGAVALADGHLQERVPVHRHDELGQLAEAFNAMAQRLALQQKDLEERVEQRSREVIRNARLADLGTLTAGIAHEINNPLAAIVACAEGLLRGGDGAVPEPAREYLEIMRKEAMRARDITTRMLSFARQEHGGRESLQLADLLREVAQLFHHQMQQRSLRLVLDTPPPQHAVSGDGGEWRQVLFNLLRNALDASPRGGTITAHVQASGDVVDMTVADEGPGVPVELRERVFEPFFTTKDPGQGTGLGLAIVHRIVAGNGGRIWVDESPKGGACFHVEMPAADGGSR